VRLKKRCQTIQDKTDLRNKTVKSLSAPAAHFIEEYLATVMDRPVLPDSPIRGLRLPARSPNMRSTKAGIAKP
jgi:hypothetical protein